MAYPKAGKLRTGKTHQQRTITVYIPDNMVRGLHDNTRPLLIYRNDDGSFKCGFVLRPDEFVTSLIKLNEARKAAGLPIVDVLGNPL